MHLSFFYFDFSSIDKPTVVAVLLGQVVVIAALFILYKLYKSLIPIILKVLRKQKEADLPSYSHNVKKNTTESDDVNAAIAMALYLHFNKLHDKENYMMTIGRLSNSYSPWSSKVFSMRNLRR
ncbi:MAG: hypothetical protein LLG13_05050 [Bacteroidales bacterium]|nr:hypothetical protein [Bacteroidales bacterium]